MAGTTTYYGISYPTSTDYVKDGATAMQTIADGFDSAVAIPTYNNQTGTSYTFVLADAGKTVTSNNALAVTFTIPPQASVAWANNTTLTVRNLGAGVVTIAGGAGVTVTNTAQTVAQYGEVKLIRTASNAWTVVPASGGTSGLTLITSQTITAQSTFDITSCFSSTYDNYVLIFNPTAASTTNQVFVRLLSGSTPATGADYYYALLGFTSGGAGANITGSGQSSLTFIEINSADASQSSAILNINKPFLSLYTGFHCSYQMSNGSSWFIRNGGGFHYTVNSYNGLRLYTNTGTMSGVVRVYGYQNS